MSIEQRLGGVLRRLRAGRQGATATIFALAMPVMTGGLALGIDFSLYNMVHNRMQTAVDGAALAAAAQIEKGGDITTTALNFLAADTPAAFGNMTTAGDITLGIYDNENGFRPDSSSNANAVRVRGERSPARGNPVNQLFTALFVDDVKTISVEAIAARPVNVFYQPPESKSLDPEAGDYNELYVYCFDSKGSGSPESRRTQMTLVSNNLPAGQDIVQISGGRISANPPANPVWPRCTQEGQTLSIRLRNVRHVKANPVLWANPAATISGVQPGRPEYNYYTDTLLEDWVERFDLQGFNILETVRCDSLAQCTPGTSSSILPSGRNRQATRRRETQPCEPNKYMYFGFEDRPPGQTGANANWLQPAWTDTDYDDIRIVMRCPASGRLGDAYVRLVG
ncbi:TadE/TadG family type IV pilus assembly protein [Sandarakinorhabdus oryzae]|uniref:TadE/TadG family type IV pilus assembly protein n=1 Tax=Sandarakinorhabdus oryzae TaxID=2675220 RepID=UPI0012E0E2E1|nr:TadE/TadG family type IV pilus assembly protein [Sandarakinorhabdus oryzae]